MNSLQKYALCLVHALIGVISPNFRMVSITRHSEKLIIQIILEIRDEEDVEEIDDLATEFEALWGQPIEFDIRLEVSQDPIIP